MVFLVILIYFWHMSELKDIQKDNNELETSIREVNSALSQYLRQVELHRTYYALKKISEDTNSK